MANYQVPYTLADIRKKIRRITGRASQSQITDDEIDKYINTFYIFDMPEHLRMESLRVNFQFVTTANRAVYDFPTDLYLTNMPPVYIAGYQSYMTQSRQNFFRVNPQLSFLQQQIATGTGATGPYTGTLINTPIATGFKPNPPGCFTPSVFGTSTDIAPKFINWNVLITGQGAPDATTGIAPYYSLVDDGLGNLFDINDASSDPTNTATQTGARGSINYITGDVSIFGPVDGFGNPTGFLGVIPSGNPINAQYIPYVASRPQSVVFFQDQFIVYPIPDQAYTVSFEAYKYPTALDSDEASVTPQLREWWQMLAYGAADKIFADNADFENMTKFRPLLDEQMRLCERRTIVQQTSERTATIYTEQTGFGQFPFGNLFSGF